MLKQIYINATHKLLMDINQFFHDIHYFRYVNIYNKMLDLDLDFTDLSTNIFHNDCPGIVEPLKKISITRLLQVRIKNYTNDKIQGGLCRWFFDKKFLFRY